MGLLLETETEFWFQCVPDRGWVDNVIDRLTSNPPPFNLSQLSCYPSAHLTHTYKMGSE